MCKAELEFTNFGLDLVLRESERKFNTQIHKNIHIFHQISPLNMNYTMHFKENDTVHSLIEYL